MLYGIYTHWYMDGVHFLSRSNFCPIFAWQHMLTVTQRQGTDFYTCSACGHAVQHVGMLCCVTCMLHQSTSTYTYQIYMHFVVVMNFLCANRIIVCALLRKSSIQWAAYMNLWCMCTLLLVYPAAVLRLARGEKWVDLRHCHMWSPLPSSSQPAHFQDNSYLT